MAKGLRQVTIANPSVEALRPQKEKDFAAKHKVLKTDSAAYNLPQVKGPKGDADKVFKASNIKVASRKSYANSDETSPSTDSYGPGKLQTGQWIDTEETEVNEIMWPLGRMTMKSPKEPKKPVISNPSSMPLSTKYNKGTKKYETKPMTKEEWLHEISQRLIYEYINRSEPADDLGSMWGRGRVPKKTKKEDDKPNELGTAWDRPAKKIKWPTSTPKVSKGGFWGSGGQKAKYREVAGQLRREEEEEQLDEKYLGFNKLKSKIASKGGVRNPGAIAAKIGMAKYGKKKFEKAAHSGKKMRGMKAK